VLARKFVESQFKLRSCQIPRASREYSTIVRQSQSLVSLAAKLDGARERINGQQAGINANRKHDDPAIREWARGKQRLANTERAHFRASLADEDRNQIEERIDQLVHDNPTLSPLTGRIPDSKAQPTYVVERLEEYYFLRDMIG
jgi:hypothetical protein